MKRLIGCIILFIVMHIIVFMLAIKKLENHIFSGYHAHFIAFFMLTFILSLILMHKDIIKYPFVISFLYVSFVAIMIELLQLKLAYRTFSFYDILAGILGAGSYSIIGYIAKKKGIFKFWYQ